MNPPDPRKLEAWFRYCRDSRDMVDKAARERYSQYLEEIKAIERGEIPLKGEKRE